MDNRRKAVTLILLAFILSLMWQSFSVLRAMFWACVSIWRQHL